MTWSSFTLLCETVRYFCCATPCTFPFAKRPAGILRHYDVVADTWNTLYKFMYYIKTSTTQAVVQCAIFLVHGWGTIHNFSFHGRAVSNDFQYYCSRRGWELGSWTVEFYGPFVSWYGGWPRHASSQKPKLYNDTYLPTLLHLHLSGWFFFITMTTRSVNVLFFSFLTLPRGILII